MPDFLFQPLRGVLQLGPPRLFENEGSAPGAIGPWWWVVATIGVIALVCVALRWLKRTRLSDERLAFVLMGRRLGLRRSHRDAIERLAQRSGGDPIGLLMCESAFARAAAGERLGPSRSVERKPVLLTGAELSELGSACEQLFGPGATDRLQRSGDDDHQEEEPDDDREQRGQWVA